MTFDAHAFLLCTVEVSIPILRALATLGLGWLAAFVIRDLTRRLAAAFRPRGAIGRRTRVTLRVTPIATTLADAAFWFVLLLSLGPALDAVPVAALDPARRAVQATLAVLPKLLGALGAVFAYVLVARIVQRLVASLLATVGIDRVMTVFDSKVTSATPRPSVIAGYVAGTVLVSLGIKQALALHDFGELSRLVNNLIPVLMRLLIAWVTLGIGMIVGQLTYRALTPTGAATTLASLTRMAIVATASAHALLASDLDRTVVTFAYGAAIASAAIAFGLGGRDAAAQLITRRGHVPIGATGREAGRQ